MPARAGLAFVFALTLATATRAQEPSVASGESFDVRHYAVQLDLDVAAGAIAGREQIDLAMTSPGKALVFDCGALIVDAVAAGGRAVAFTQAARKLTLTLPDAARAGGTRRID